MFEFGGRGGGGEMEVVVWRLYKKNAIVSKSAVEELSSWHQEVRVPKRNARVHRYSHVLEAIL